MDVLELAAPGAVVLLNAPYAPDQLWDRLPREFQETMLEKKLQLHVIDAVKVAQAAGMGGRINAVMQACFFALSGVLPRDEAIDQIKKSIEKTYKKKGPEVVRRNHAAVDASLAALFPVKVPGKMTATRGRPPVVAPEAPDFVRRVTAVMLENKGDLLPVSAFPVDGTWPTATAKWEKRNLALEIPVWDGPICIQCNKCALVCPHAAIRTKVYGEGAVATAPQGLQAHGLQGPGRERLHGAGRPGGLHRLRAVHRGLPGQGQGEPAAQGAGVRATAAAPRARKRSPSSSSSTCPRWIEPRSGWT